MNIKNTKIDDLNYQVTMEIAAEDYQPAEKKMLAERKRNADFKGFRRGMAPMSLIQRVYGEQALAEAVNEVISENLNNFIKENNLHVVGEPLASEDQPQNDWKSGNAFTFKFDIAQTPELTFEVGKEDKVPVYNIEVTEVAKNEMKQNMLRQVGSMQDGEVAGEEDFIIATLSNGTISAEDVYIAIRNIEGKAHKKFVGCKAGSNLTIDINEAFSNETDRAAMIKVKKEELANVDPKFKVAVKTVKTFVPAEENQETYDRLFGKDSVHNAEEFDKAVEARLTENYKQEADYRLSKDIQDYLVKKADIKLPEAFLKRWLYKVNEGKFTMEDIEKEFDMFLADFRWQLVREYLMKKFDQKVEDKDIHEAAEAYVAYQYAMYGMGNVPQEMIHEAAHRIMGDERQMRQIEENVEAQKVITAVKGVISTTKKKITVEKFRELK